jgi:hypothetical protein
MPRDVVRVASYSVDTDRSRRSRLPLRPLLPRLVPDHAAWHLDCTPFGMARLQPRWPLRLWRRIRSQMLVDFLLVMLAAVIVIKTFLLLLGVAT